MLTYAHLYVATFILGTSYDKHQPHQNRKESARCRQYNPQRGAITRGRSDCTKVGDVDTVVDIIPDSTDIQGYIK